MPRDWPTDDGHAANLPSHIRHAEREPMPNDAPMMPVVLLHEGIGFSQRQRHHLVPHALELHRLASVARLPPQHAPVMPRSRRAMDRSVSAKHPMRGRSDPQRYRRHNPIRAPAEVVLAPHFISQVFSFHLLSMLNRHLYAARSAAVRHALHCVCLDPGINRSNAPHAHRERWNFLATGSCVVSAPRFWAWTR